MAGMSDSGSEEKLLSEDADAPYEDQAAAINEVRDSTNPSSSSSTVAELPLGLWEGVSIILGTMIGSGIFASPGSVLMHSGSVGLSLIVWVVAGSIALLGSVSTASVACCFQIFQMVPLAL